MPEELANGLANCGLDPKNFDHPEAYDIVADYLDGFTTSREALGRLVLWLQSR